MNDYPKVIVGNDIGGGKTFYQIQQLIKELESYNDTPVENMSTVKYLSNCIVKLSRGVVEVRIWYNRGRIFCTPVYLNNTVKKMFVG